MTSSGKMANPNNAARWIISASHCLGKKASLNVNRCIAGCRCQKTELGDFVFYPDKIKSYIRIGIKNFMKELKTSKAYEIEKIIRPQKAYPSGGYGVSIFGTTSLTPSDICPEWHSPISRDPTIANLILFQSKIILRRFFIWLAVRFFLTH